jgi:hypothetical protein
MPLKVVSPVMGLELLLRSAASDVPHVHDRVARDVTCEAIRLRHYSFEWAAPCSRDAAIVHRSAEFPLERDLTSLHTSIHEGW